MTLTSSLFAGVSGLTSQGSVLGVLGDNIANISTTGFKSGTTTFASLVTGDASAGGVGAGAIADTRIEIDQQGTIQTTGVATDIAISGQGFFIVKDDAEASDASTFYTRAGSFRQDSRGNFINSSGFALQAYPLDNEGRLPGQVGNANTTSSQLLESLETVNTRDISGLAFATTTISLGINLDASQAILTGAGDDFEPISSSLNASASSSQILIPTATLNLNDTLDITTAGSPETAGTENFVFGGLARTADITAVSIFGAASTSGVFATGAGLANSDAFSITSVTSGSGTVVNSFTFTTGTPVASSGTFNSLNSLANAIEATTELTASIVDNQLLISATDARGSIAFADVTGTMIGANAFEPANTNFVNIAASAGNRFNTMDGLNALLNDDSNPLAGAVSSSANDASINITVTDPLSSITFTNNAANTGTGFAAEFGLTTGTTFAAIYDATGTVGQNMASGNISSAFSRNIRVFDGVGEGHDLRVSFAKAANNKWLVEVFAADTTDVTEAPGFTDGQLATGTIEFNGDGTLSSISSGLLDTFTPAWANGSEAAPIALNLGTAGQPASAGATNTGLTDGLSQFSGPYTVQFAEQNGAGSGLLSSIEISEDGFVVANFTNGQSRNVFKIPLASFPNVNGLTPRAGNVFAASDASGEFSLNEVGDSGVGTLSNQALEGANVELADELTKIIVAQRAFQANTKIITTADELLEELNRI